MNAHFELYAMAIVTAFGLFHLGIVVFCGPKRRKEGGVRP